MYHAIFLEDLLDLCNLAVAFPGLVLAPALGGWTLTALRMQNWLDGMTHPDGEIAFFNDAAIGISKSTAQLRSYAARLGIQQPQCSRSPLTTFPDSGYSRLENSDAVALLDVAPIGPDHLPGHAHADTLSFELSVHGHRIIVNGGTSCYGTGPERHRERQTASHSTVEIDGLDSSEVWASFRVARRAYPFGFSTSQEGEVLSVACSHDGYKRLSDRPIHRREWVLRPNSLTIEDTIIGRYETAVARFLIHPDHRIVANDSGWTITLPEGRIVRVSVIGGAGQLLVASYAPEFGKVVSTSCLAVKVLEGNALTRLEWD